MKVGDMHGVFVQCDCCRVNTRQWYAINLGLEVPIAPSELPWPVLYVCHIHI